MTAVWADTLGLLVGTSTLGVKVVFPPSTVGTVTVLLSIVVVSCLSVVSVWFGWSDGFCVVSSDGDVVESCLSVLGSTVEEESFGNTASSLLGSVVLGVVGSVLASGIEGVTFGVAVLSTGGMVGVGLVSEGVHEGCVGVTTTLAVESTGGVPSSAKAAT